MSRFLIGLVLLASPIAVCAANDSAPSLVSTTGGAKTWSDLGELQHAAESGDVDAMAAYGEMLVTGDGVTKDVNGGLSLLERAAQRNNANAAFRLGKMYEDGDGVPADANKALDYYRRAALGGVAEAQYNLGAMYVSARDGLKRDFKEGLAWLIVAAKNGAPEEGAQRVRDRLTASRRGDIIPAAEQRAIEIEKDIEAHRPAPAKKK